MHMCGIIHSEHVCVLLHSTVIISTSVFDGSLHTEHMGAYMYKYLVSSVDVCANSYTEVYACECVREGICVCAFAIYFSEWVAKFSNASCASVCT